MDKPIIDPSTLSDVQREAIVQELESWRVFLGSRDENMALGAIASIREIFGEELVESIMKQEETE